MVMAAWLVSWMLPAEGGVVVGGGGGEDGVGRRRVGEL